MPSWLESDVLDVRSTVIQHLSSTPRSPEEPVRFPGLNKYPPRLHVPIAQGSTAGLNSRSLNIPNQLRVLGLPAFQGREHSGIDVGALSQFL